MSGTSPDGNASTKRETLPFADPAVVGLPMSVGELIRCGGVSRFERQAADQAIAQERRFWLPVLEAWLDQCSEDDWYETAYLTGEIRRLRRLTGIPASLERRRAQGRERVRRWRARRSPPATVMETSS
jgi:hypothetical protein